VGENNITRTLGASFYHQYCIRIARHYPSVRFAARKQAVMDDARRSNNQQQSII
jgi:hypothetical protein